MKLLLDTHVVLWALQDSPRLPLYIREQILEESNEIYVSAMSLYEIAIKHKKSPDKFPYTADEIREYCQRAGFIFLSLSLDTIHVYEQYDFSKHLDPFDQILVAQSVCNNMRLITHDEKLKSYNLGFVELF